MVIIPAGYQGIGRIAGEDVLITTGGFQTGKNVSYISTSLFNATTNSKSKKRHMDGIHEFSGSIGFELTDGLTSSLFGSTGLLSRGFIFDVIIFDGVEAYEMTDCLAASVSISAAPGGNIGCDVSFVSTTPFSSTTNPSSDNYLSDVNEPLNKPIAYWYSGNTDVREWGLSFSQDLTPVYANEDSTNPKYFKVGEIEYTLDVTTFNDIEEHDNVEIHVNNYTISGDTVSEGYNYEGAGSRGSYTHSFGSGSITTSDATVLTIT